MKYRSVISTRPSAASLAAGSLFMLLYLVFSPLAAHNEPEQWVIRYELSLRNTDKQYLNEQLGTAESEFVGATPVSLSPLLVAFKGPAPKISGPTCARKASTALCR